MTVFSVASPPPPPFGVPLALLSWVGLTNLEGFLGGPRGLGGGLGSAILLLYYYVLLLQNTTTITSLPGLKLGRLWRGV